MGYGKEVRPVTILERILEWMADVQSRARARQSFNHLADWLDTLFFK
jgi:hypothetical protein